MRLRPRLWRFTLLFAPIRRNSNYEPGGFTGARSPAKSFRNRLTGVFRRLTMNFSLRKAPYP